MTTPEQFLARFPPEVQYLGDLLRAHVKSTLPDALEQYYTGWNVIGFKVRAGARTVYFGYVNAHKDHATLGFTYGYLLDDPHALLQNENLKRVRFLVLRAPEDLRAEPFTALIRQAAEIALMPSGLRRLLG
jgi:hypothetical protein